VVEPFVKWAHAHLAHAGLDHLADGVFDHGGGDAGGEAEAVGEVGGDIVFAARDVHVEAARLAEGDHPGVEAVNQSADREKIEVAGVLTNIEFLHACSFCVKMAR